MSIFETFSKRMKKKKRAGQPDVFQYDELPEPFRVQVIHIWRDSIGIVRDYDRASVTWWKFIHDQMSRELGLFQLAKHGDDPFQKCQQFLLACETLEALDLIELSFRMVDRAVRGYRAKNDYKNLPKQTPDDAITELNERFYEHGIGYEFVGGELVRKDSQFIHAEAVRPALQLLSEEKFRGANEEFLRAHEHYRHGRHKEAMQEALKAFESTLKTICDLRRWSYKSTDTAKRLIAVVIENGLLPSFLSTHLPALATVLESGLPTVRNKLAGHGQGAVPIDAPPHLVSFALHLAASNIVMLIEAHRAKK